MTSKTDTFNNVETPTYWMLRRLKALRDSGIDVTLDDLFVVASKGDRFLSVEELVDCVEMQAFYRKNKETAK